MNTSSQEKQIHNIFKKNPSWRNIFLSWLDNNENLNIESLKNDFSILMKYKSLLKDEINIQSIKHFDPEAKPEELLHDKIHEVLNRKQKNNFIKSLKTQNYNHLFNEDVEKEIHTILDNKITISSLKHQFFNKLARFKDSNHLLESLTSFKNKNLSWNKEHFLGKIKEENLFVDIISSKNNTLMVEVKDFNSCSQLGSQAWCIVQDKGHFKTYANNNRQLIYFDFNKTIEDNESMIGITVQINGEIYDSCLKNDKATPSHILDKFTFKKLSRKEIENFIHYKFKDENSIKSIYRRLREIDPSIKCNDLILKDNFKLYINFIDINQNYMMNYINNSEESLLKSFNFITKEENYLKNYSEYCLSGAEFTEPQKHDNNKYLERLFLNNDIEKIQEILYHKNVGKSFHIVQIIIKAIAYKQNDFIMPFLKNKNCPIKHAFNNIYMVAVKYNDITTTKFLLKQKDVDCSYAGDSAIRLCISSENETLLKEILKNKIVNVLGRNKDILIAALHKKNSKIVKMLLSNSTSKFGDESNTLISIAAKAGNVDSLKLILMDKKTSFKKRRDTDSLFFILSTEDKSDIIKLLIKNKDFVKTINPKEAQFRLTDQENKILLATVNKSKSDKKNKPKVI